MNSCKQNWHIACENELNEHINREYTASLNYHYLSSYFNNDSQGLTKLADYFNKCSLEERQHADELMKYQNKRGGTVVLKGILNPSVEFKTNNEVLEALNIAFKLEKEINHYLIQLHKIASENEDAQFCDYLEGTFLNEQVESIYDLTKKINILRKINEENYHGIWHFVEVNF